MITLLLVSTTEKPNRRSASNYKTLYTEWDWEFNELEPPSWVSGSSRPFRSLSIRRLLDLSVPSVMAEPTLFDTIQNAIISDTVLSTLSPIEIQSLSLTCRTAQDAITSYRRCAWNIDNRLRRHFHDPLAFRSLQAKTDTIISGRFALDFFARTTSLETPLDICVPLEHFLEVGKWLLNETSGGYRFQPSETQLQNFEEMLMKPRDHINIVVPENLEDHFTGIAAGFDFVHLEDPAVKVRMSVAESSVFKIVFNASSSRFSNQRSLTVPQ